MKKLLIFLIMPFIWATTASAQVASDEELAMRPAQVKQFLSGKTVRTYNRDGLGNMITYFAPNGQMYIWPPRRAVLTPGTWKACTTDAQMVNGSTKKVEDIKLAAICRTLHGNGQKSSANINWIAFKNMIQEYETGDIFALTKRNGQAPYAMGKRSVDFNYLRGKIK